jgi:hypothetical protein
MQDADAHLIEANCRARHLLNDRDAPIRGQGAERATRLVARNRDPLPDLAWIEVADQRGAAAHVIRIAVCDREDVQPTDPASPQGRCEDAASNVECRTVEAGATGIDHRRPATWSLEQQGITLADVKRCKQQAAGQRN